MATIYFVNENKRVESIGEETILDAGRRADIFIEAPCGGNGRCGKCKVHVSDGRGDVLACNTYITGDVEVLTDTKTHKRDTMQILLDGKSGETSVNNFKNHKYGIAVDIGTTTLVVSLVDCDSGKELEVVSALNPQCEYGQDVMSRIQYTEDNQEGLSVLHHRLQDEMNRMIKILSDRAGIEQTQITDAVYSGNTVMLHLATNNNPSSMGKYPYNMEMNGGMSMDAADVGVQISNVGKVYVPPFVSAFIGADLISGVLVCDLETQTGTTLFMDIGTNGEMVLANDGELVATSTAAGPAFEGMNITFGMRASAGAIESFQIDDVGSITMQTVGGVKPVGICGSGLFDIVGELVRIGIIEKSGRFTKKTEHLPKDLVERMTLYQGSRAFLITEGVYLTQKDVRQIQLAKGAISSGIEALLGIREIPVHQIDKVVFAGAFGYHLKVESMVNIGLIPEQLEEKVEFVGNTSKTGAIAFLLETENRRRMEKLVLKVEHINLSDYKNFEQLFVKSCYLTRHVI